MSTHEIKQEAGFDRLSKELAVRDRNMIIFLVVLFAALMAFLSAAVAIIGGVIGWG